MLNRVKLCWSTVILILIVIFTVNLLNRGPDLIKYLTKPAGKWYSGQASWFDPWDHNVYFSAIGWGKRGGLAFPNLYDTQSKKPMFVYTAYVLIGKLTKILNISNSLSFHLAAVFFSFVLGIIIWWFLGIFIKEKKEKIVIYILLIFGGGLGWLFFPQLVLPDLGQPGFILESAFRRPHEAISSSVFLLTIGFFWQGINKKDKKLLIMGAVSAFLMSFFHPYTLLTLVIIFFTWASFYWFKNSDTKYFSILIYLGLSGTVWLIIIGKSLIENPGFSGLMLQVQKSPAPLLVVLGWGILFPFTLMSLFNKTDNKEDNFLKIWFIFGWLIIYLPFGFQRLLIRGLWFPVVILAVKSLSWLAKKFSLNYISLAVIIIIFSSPTSFSTFFRRLNESPENRWIYLSADEGEVINYLRLKGKNEEGVMASYRIANLIPAQTAKRVWAGHEFQTPDFNNRIQEVNKFYANKMTDNEARSFLNKTGTSWVFFGQDEKDISQGKNLKYRFLKPVIVKKNVILYQK
jgi:hypothetical protein